MSGFGDAIDCRIINVGCQAYRMQAQSLGSAASAQRGKMNSRLPAPRYNDGEYEDEPSEGCRQADRQQQDAVVQVLSRSQAEAFLTNKGPEHPVPSGSKTEDLQVDVDEEPAGSGNFVSRISCDKVVSAWLLDK